MKLSRRSMVTLAAASPIAGLGFPGGGELDSAMVGVMIRIALQRGGWTVLIPDWDSVGSYWRPGMAVPSKWVPLNDFLKSAEQEFGAQT
jgi:hypothetical protein